MSHIIMGYFICPLVNITFGLKRITVIEYEYEYEYECECYARKDMVHLSL